MVGKIGELVQTLNVLRLEYVKAFHELDGEFEKIWKAMKELPNSDFVSRPFTENGKASKAARAYVKFWFFPAKIVGAAQKVLETYMGGEEKLLAQAASLEKTVTALHSRVNEGLAQLQKTEQVIEKSLAIDAEAQKLLAELQKSEALMLKSIKKLFPELSQVKDLTCAIQEKMATLGSSQEYRAKCLMSYQRITQAIAQIQAHMPKHTAVDAWGEACIS